MQKRNFNREGGGKEGLTDCRLKWVAKKKKKYCCKPILKGPLGPTHYKWKQGSRNENLFHRGCTAVGKLNHPENEHLLILHSKARTRQIPDQRENRGGGERQRRESVGKKEGEK